MRVLYANARLRDTCASDKAMVRRYGATRARRLQLRLQHLRVAETLADLRQLGGHPHELTGNFKGAIAVSLDGPYRLVMRPLDADGEVIEPPIDWTSVRAVVIDDVVDYH
ncbi:type II toxin-antitoxin system RelE/ParE family toxin [Streptomyces olivaceoviridis]